ncbi:hypothetical protein [Fluviibacterium sp. S390]|uniref:hypothetical protein n=1 Tax=Fluviibacterium sp. S390 TaxID=3415139 RepID=UPI003C7D48D5
MTAASTNSSASVIFSRFIPAAVLSIAILGASTAPAAERPKDVFVVADMSSLNAVVTNKAYNEKARKLLLKEIDSLGLDYLDHLHLRTAGAPSAIGEFLPEWNRDIEFIYRKANPSAVPGFLTKRVHELMETESRSDVDLVWSLQELARATRCDSHDTYIFVLTNALEAGRFDGNRFGMPRLIGTPYQGCASLTLIGFGAGDQTGSVTRLSSAEKAFRIVVEEAGFARFTILR